MSHFSYQSIEDVLLSNGATIHTAEAHGMLAGMLCLDDRMGHEQWLDAVFGKAKAALHRDERALMFELCEATRRLLSEMDFSFELFLPDDDTALAERALALSEWCRGFLSGLNYEAGGRVWPSDCDEVLRDLRAVCELDPEAAGEDDENAYAEISEFVRVAAQLIHGELQQQPKPPRFH